MLEGLWSVELGITEAETEGAGVVIFENQRIIECDWRRSSPFQQKGERNAATQLPTFRREIGKGFPRRRLESLKRKGGENGRQSIRP